MFPQQNILFGYMDENGNPISSLGDKVKVNGTIRYPLIRMCILNALMITIPVKQKHTSAAYEKKGRWNFISLWVCIRPRFLGTLLDGADTRSPWMIIPVYQYADCLLLLAQAKAF